MLCQISPVQWMQYPRQLLTWLRLAVKQSTRPMTKFYAKKCLDLSNESMEHPSSSKKPVPCLRLIRIRSPRGKNWSKELEVKEHRHKHRHRHFYPSSPTTASVQHTSAQVLELVYVCTRTLTPRATATPILTHATGHRGNSSKTHSLKCFLPVAQVFSLSLNLIYFAPALLLWLALMNICFTLSLSFSLSLSLTFSPCPLTHTHSNSHLHSIQAYYRAHHLSFCAWMSLKFERWFVSAKRYSITSLSPKLLKQWKTWFNLLKTFPPASPKFLAMSMHAKKNSLTWSTEIFLFDALTLSSLSHQF